MGEAGRAAMGLSEGAAPPPSARMIDVLASYDPAARTSTRSGRTRMSSSAPLPSASEPGIGRPGVAVRWNPSTRSRAMYELPTLICPR